MPIDETAAKRSVLIRNLLEHLGQSGSSEENSIPLSEVCPSALIASRHALSLTSAQVNGAVLRKVMDWCSHHQKEALPDDSDGEDKFVKIDEWDQKFISVDQELLFEIILVSLLLVAWPWKLTCKRPGRQLS